MSQPAGNVVMLEDITSQEDALTQGLAQARDAATSLEVPGFRRVVLTGSGDSFIAAAAVQSLFEHYLGVPVLALPSLEAGRYVAFRTSDVVVSISVSGEVARTVEAAGRASAAGATVLAVTANPQSSLAGSAKGALLIPEPIDRSIPHCRDYTTTLIVLVALLEGLISERLPEADTLPALTSEVVAWSFATIRPQPPGGRTWFLGAGPDRATAMFGALKFWEAAGMEAWWDDLEEFGHGSQLMARPGDRAVLIAAGRGCERALEMLDGLDRMGLRSLLVGGSPMSSDGTTHLFTTDELDALWHPFISCVPLQVLTYVEAGALDLDVSVPLFGHSHGATYDEVHLEWTKESRVVIEDRIGP